MPTRRTPADPKAAILEALRASPGPLIRTELYHEVLMSAFKTADFHIMAELADAGLVRIERVTRQRVTEYTVTEYHATNRERRKPK
jgi:DNA-binding transcriptional ArsR family regulator